MEQLQDEFHKNGTLRFKQITSNLLLGIDIGGSLAKLCIVVLKTSIDEITYIRSLKAFDEIEAPNYMIFLTLCQTPRSDNMICEVDNGSNNCSSSNTTNNNSTEFPLLFKLTSKYNIKKVDATGGGSEKFNNFVKKQLNIEFQKHDELISLVNGYLFLNQFNPFYKVENSKDIVRVPSTDLTFPHIAVNIGSGVSVLRVDSPNYKDVHRVAGTIMGGGTLLGLAKLLIGVDNYNDILELAQKGDNRKVDLTVKDIYGNQDKVGGDVIDLAGDVVASSFGKIHELIGVNKMDKFSKEDIAMGLLSMICFHITQIAKLVAEENNINHILFFGNFTRRGSFAVLCLNQCMKFWENKFKIRFNYYDGYLGSIGTLVEEK